MVVQRVSGRNFMDTLQMMSHLGKYNGVMAKYNCVFLSHKLFMFSTLYIQNRSFLLSQGHMAASM